MESVLLKPGLPDEKRRRLILNELNIVGKEIDNKQVEAQSKANLYRIINTLSSLLIIISAAVIAGMEATSNCLNIPVLIFSGIIFFTEGTHKLCQWGPQGVLYMHGSIQLKKLQRQAKEYMFFFQRYTTEQLLTLINILRDQCDDVDMGLYKLSMSGQVHSGFDVDPRENTPQVSPFVSPLSTPRDSPNSRINRSDVHIHIDSTPRQESGDAPVLIIPTEDTHITNKLTPGTPVKRISNYKLDNTPPTPRLHSRVSTPREDNESVVIDIPNDIPN